MSENREITSSKASQMPEFRRFISSVQERLSLPSMPPHIMAFFLMVFILVMQGCTSGDELFDADGITGVEVLECGYEGNDLVLTLDMTTSEIITNFTIEVVGPGADSTWQASFDELNNQYQYPANNNVEGAIGTDGAIEVDLRVTGGGAGTSLYLSRREDGRQQGRLFEDLGCLPPHSGFEIVSAETISCVNENGVMEVSIEYTVNGDDTDGILKDFSFGTAGAGQTSVATMTVNGLTADEGTSMDIDLGGGTTFIAVYTIPNGDETTDINNNFITEPSTGDTQQNYPITDPGCETPCDPRDVEGVILERDPSDHHKGIAFFKVDDCDVQGSVRFGFGSTHGHNALTYILNYPGYSETMVVDPSQDIALIVDPQIQSIQVKYNSNEPIEDGDQCTLILDLFSDTITYN